MRAKAAAIFLLSLHLPHFDEALIHRSLFKVTIVRHLESKRPPPKAHEYQIARFFSLATHQFAVCLQCTGYLPKTCCSSHPQHGCKRGCQMGGTGCEWFQPIKIEHRHFAQRFLCAVGSLSGMLTCPSSHSNRSPASSHALAPCKCTWFSGKTIAPVHRANVFEPTTMWPIVSTKSTPNSPFSTWGISWWTSKMWRLICVHPFGKPFQPKRLFGSNRSLSFSGLAQGTLSAAPKADITKTGITKMDTTSAPAPGAGTAPYGFSLQASPHQKKPD